MIAPTALSDPPAAEAPTVLVAQRGQRVLVLQGNVGTEPLVAVADGWWESDGQAIQAPPGSGLVRATDRSAPPGSTGQAIHNEVRVVVRSRELGVKLVYHLSPPGTTLLQTGLEQGDGGSAAGLAPDERPRRLRDQGLAGPAWEVPSSDPRGRSSVGRFRGADIHQLELDPAEGPPSIVPRGGDGLKALLADLRPATAAAWADAVRSVDPQPDPALLSATLASGPRAALPTTTTGLDTPVTASGAATSPPTSTSPPDASAQAASETQREATETETETETETGPTSTETRTDAEAAAAALVDFAEQPSDATFAALPLADDVTIDFGFAADGDALVVAAAGLRDPARWAKDADMAYGRDGPISPLELISAARGHVIVDPSSPEATCGGQAAARGGTPSAAIVSTDVASCIDWFAVIVQLDDEGSISHALMRLYEP